MDGFLLQNWTTIRGTASGAAPVLGLTQDEDEWLDLGDFADASFAIDVVDITQPTGTLVLNLETSPTPEDLLFTPVTPPIAISVSPNVSMVKSTRTPTTAPLARWLRWRISGATGGSWSVTFRVRVMPGRTSFFTPVALSGALLWLRADLGIVGPSNSITNWKDQSGNGNDMTSAFTPGTGANPTLLTGSANFNGQPAIQFSGMNWMSSASFSVGTVSVFMVTSGESAGATGYFWTRGSPVTDTLYSSTSATMSVVRGGVTSAWDLLANWGQFGSKAQSLVKLYDGTNLGQKLRINGVQQSMTNTIANDPGTAAVAGAFTVAADSSGGLPSTINVAEVAIFDHSLLSSELRQLEEYARQRYALY